MSESAEMVAHKAMREVAEKIFDDHGIIVEAVKFNWFEHETFGEDPVVELRSINLATKVIG